MGQKTILPGLLILIIGLFLVPAHVNSSSAARSKQNDAIAGYMLTHLAVPGDRDNPEHLYWMDSGESIVSELLVENRSIYSPWSGWSPDGRNLAYLAPAREGINYELWVARANGGQRVTPFFDLRVTILTAAWNSQFNIIAVATDSEDAMLDGLYLYNIVTGLVFLGEENEFSGEALLDWSHDAVWLMYSTGNGDLKVINTGDKNPVLIQSGIYPQILPDHKTGWSADDKFYIFTDSTYQTVYLSTLDDGIQPIDDWFHLDFSPDAYQVLLYPGSHHLLIEAATAFYLADMNTREIENITPDIPDTPYSPFFVTAEETIIMNTSDENGILSCYVVVPQAGFIPVRDELPESQLPWTHVECELLDGGQYLAVVATTTAADIDNLPVDHTYTLFVMPVNLTQTYRMTDFYSGFDLSPIEFSSQREQLFFVENQELVVYHLNGQKKGITTLNDLDVTTSFVDYRVAWQP